MAKTQAPARRFVKNAGFLKISLTKSKKNILMRWHSLGIWRAFAGICEAFGRVSLAFAILGPPKVLSFSILGGILGCYQLALYIILRGKRELALGKSDVSPNKRLSSQHDGLHTQDILLEFYLLEFYSQHFFVSF